MNQYQHSVGKGRSPFYGWWIVAISFVVHALSLGFYWLGFAVFFLPISRDLRINRAAASLPFTLRELVAIVESTPVGMLVDRIGVSKILLIAGLFGGSGYLLLSRIDGYVAFIVVFLAVISTGMMHLDAPTTVAIGRWFPRKSGQPMSIGFMGFAFGGAVLTPLLAIGVDMLGWRMAAVITGGVIWAIIVPLAVWFFKSPTGTDEGIQNNVGRPMTHQVSATTQQVVLPVDFRVSDALQSWTYWTLSVSCGLRSMVFAAMGLHLVAIMTWRGLDETTAGLLVGGFAFIWMLSTLVMGWIGDRWSKSRTAAMPAFLGATSMFILMQLDTVSVWKMALLLGMYASNEGSWALNFSLLGDLFGRRNYGALRGAMMAIIHFMTLGSPIYAGWVFDKTNSYEWVLLPAGLCLCLAGILNWVLPARRSLTSNG